jgi:hypothetical protein
MNIETKANGEAMSENAIFGRKLRETEGSSKMLQQYWSQVVHEINMLCTGATAVAAGPAINMANPHRILHSQTATQNTLSRCILFTTRHPFSGACEPDHLERCMPVNDCRH